MNISMLNMPLLACLVIVIIQSGDEKASQHPLHSV
jgi:hypothetical protein